MDYAKYPRSMIQETSQQIADCAMMARVVQGDQSAFRALYDRLADPLYSLACKMLGDEVEAQDAMQDVFVQIWRRAGSYDSEQSSVFTWAILLTRSRIIDRLRARGRRLRLVAASADQEDIPITAGDASVAENAAEISSRNESAMRVRTIMANLPAQQREAIELAFFGDLTHHEVAGRLGEPLGTVKARIRRGLLKLRERMQT
jgi:RNA polymerase sigma-70 factor, ECF subfamily